MAEVIPFMTHKKGCLLRLHNIVSDHVTWDDDDDDYWAVLV
jgi:hypothetical protein